MKPYDVIVIGLGGMGSAAAFHLAARGQRVLGIDQFNSLHDRGSSHGETRVIRQAYYEHPSYVPLLLRAYELWRELEKTTGRQLLLLPGGLMLGSPTSPVVTGSIESARLHKLPHEVLDSTAIRRRFPQFAIQDETVALYEQASGLLWCERSVAAHLEMASRSGAELHFEEPVLKWEAPSNGDAVTVTTSRGVYTASRLVITPGPWAPNVLGELGLPLEVTRQVMVWFQPRGGVEPFLTDRFPIYIAQLDESEVYGFPAVDGPAGGVKVAFFHKPRREIVTPESVDRTVQPHDVEELRRAIRKFVPGLDGSAIRARVCLYTTTPDHHFIICVHPAHPQVSIACGFSGHGYKFCSVVGEILTDLATTGTTRHDLSLFTPSRFNKIPSRESRSH